MNWRHRTFIAAAGALCLVASPVARAAAPTFEVRLTGPLSTTKSKVGETVTAVSVTSLVALGRTMATPGCTVTGTIKESLRPKGVNDPEVVHVEFTKIAGADKVAHEFKASVIEVDNGRESVDEQGRILGVAPVEKKPENAGDALKIAANGTQIMRALVSKVIGRVPPQIDYKAGAEFILRVDAPPKSPAINCGSVVPALDVTDELSRTVNAQPLRTLTPAGQKPSDVTNLMFVGSRELLDAAFDAAEWRTAEALSATSGAKTFLATVAGEGYHEAPVSLQHIDGRPPDAVFQKQLNTFAKRHHVRIWRTEAKFAGQDVWIGAATHDIAFAVSKETKSFAHSIDANIDAERTKIVTDLAFGGGAASYALVARPKAPKEAATSIGEPIKTDGRVAAIVLRKVR